MKYKNLLPFFKAIMMNSAFSILSVFLLLIATSARATSLSCVASDGYTLPVEIDESREEVIVGSVQARNVQISESTIVFYLDLKNGTWPHVLSRITGQLDVKSPLSGTWMPPYRCQVADRKF